MKALLQKLGLLGLSLMLVSPFAVSAALPAMIRTYQKQGYAPTQVEQLFSLSSLTILTVLLLTPYINRFLTESLAIVIGFLLIAFGGTLPVWTSGYKAVFLAHIILGSGIGLINAHAITSISRYYQGKERTKLLGWRGATEVLGSAMLTFLAGQLMIKDWTQAYWIYGTALPLLLLYLFFVPKAPPTSSAPSETSTALTPKQILTLIGKASFAGTLILINTATTMRIPLVIENLGIGSPKESSLILSLMMLMGILAGIGFSPVLKRLHTSFKVVIPLVFSLGMLLLWLGTHLITITLGAVLSGFVYSLGVTYVFYQVSEQFPQEQLRAATTLVLLGCNIGGAGAPFALQLIALYHTNLRFPYLIFALITLSIGTILSFNRPTTV